MKISTNSYWFKSGIFSLLQNFSTLVFGFGGFYFLVRLLSKEEFGGWSLFLAVTSIVEVARVGFVKNGFIKFRASSSEEVHESIFTASFFLNCCFALLISLAALASASLLASMWHTPALENMFYIYAATSLVLIPFFQFEFLLHALLDFRSVFFIYFVRNGILFLAILLSYLHIYEISLTYLVIVHFTGAFFSSLAAYFLARGKFNLLRIPEVVWIWKLTHYGKYVIGTSLSSMLYTSADQFMLGSMVSTASVAIYGTAGRINNLINMPSMILSTIMFPKSVQLMSSGGKVAVKELYEKSVGTVLGIVLPAVIFVLLFPEFVINVIAGSGYLDAVGILRITVFFSLFLSFSYQFGTVFDSIGYPNLNFYYTSVSLLTNITLNYFLISKYGILGVVYGTSFTLLAGFFVIQILLKVKLNINTLNVFRSTLLFYKSCFSFLINLLFKKKNETE